jgi:hypothetical protein
VIKRIHVLVEGQTEETFSNGILAARLARYDIYLHATRVTTRRRGGQRVYRGGVTQYGKIRKDLHNLCRDSDVVAITTMLDFYGYPEDAPGRATLPEGDCYSQVHHLEEQMSMDIQDYRLIPNLLLHEFEALLFSSPEIFLYCFSDKEKVKKLIEVRDAYGTPEKINRNMPPSIQIKEIYHEYEKVLHGNLLALEIGLDAMRGCCPHFNEWLIKLEGL